MCVQNFVPIGEVNFSGKNKVVAGSTPTEPFLHEASWIRNGIKMCSFVAVRLKLKRYNCQTQQPNT